MKAIIGQPVKLAFRNNYEGGLQGPCTAELIEVSVVPADRGKYSDGVFTAETEGDGKLVAQFIYSDGTSNSDEVMLQVSKPAVMEVKVPVQPKLIGGAILDLA